MQKEDSNRRPSSKNTMTSLNIHVMGFPPPIKYDDKMHKIILAHQIKENTGLDIKYSKIDYIIGNVWNELTHNFEPGPGANLIINKYITQNDINKINNSHRNNHTSGLIYILGHKCKSDYNNNNWYRNDIENRIAFDRFTIPYSLTNTQKIHGKPIKYHNNFENNLITNTDEKTSINIPNKRKFKHNILKNLNHKIKHNIQYNEKLDETIKNNIINTTNTSIISHPDDTKLNTKSDKKDASIVSNPNDKKLQYNKNEDENSLEKNNESLKSNKITLKQSLNGTKDCNTLPSTKSLAKSTHSKKYAISNPNGKKLIETLDKNINKNSNTIGIISSQTSTKQLLNSKTNKILNGSNKAIKHHNKLSLEVNDESLAQNRTYKEINSSLEKHKTSHSNDVSDSTCTKTHSGITTTSSTQNENPNTSIEKAETIPNDDNNIDNIDANDNATKPISNGGNNINDIDENDNKKFTYTAKTGTILYDAISTLKTIPKIHPKNGAISTKSPLQQTHPKITYHMYIPPPLRSKLLSNIKASSHDKKLDNDKKLCTSSLPKDISNDNNIDDKDENDNIKYNTLSSPKSIPFDNNNIDDENADNNIQCNPLSTPKATPNTNNIDDVNKNNNEKRTALTPETHSNSINIASHQKIRHSQALNKQLLNDKNLSNKKEYDTKNIYKKSSINNANMRALSHKTISCNEARKVHQNKMKNNYNNTIKNQLFIDNKILTPNEYILNGTNENMINRAVISLILYIMLSTKYINGNI